MVKEKVIIKNSANFNFISKYRNWQVVFCANLQKLHIFREV